jgi:hypothetical protein
LMCLLDCLLFVDCIVSIILHERYRVEPRPQAAILRIVIGIADIPNWQLRPLAGVVAS